MTPEQSTSEPSGFKLPTEIAGCLIKGKLLSLSTLACPSLKWGPPQQHQKEKEARERFKRGSCPW